MSNPLAPIFVAVLKPFILKVLPDLFTDFDESQTDFAIVDIQEGTVEFGVMDPLKIVFKKDWDVLEGIESQKVMGMSIDKEMAASIVSGLRIERYEQHTMVIAVTTLEETKDIETKFLNTDIWTEALKQGKMK